MNRSLRLEDLSVLRALWAVDAENQTEVETLIRADPFYEPAFREFDIYVWGKISEDQSVML